MSRKIEIEDSITVGTLAEKLELPVSQVIGELMKNGVLATVNERIDFDTAVIITGEIDPEVELAHKPKEEKISRKKPTSTGGQTRPPVVAVMGHVDHGKTSLLDAMCGSQVAKGESGGITQHISAYQTKHGDRSITFLDTPGHEAFAAIREHGAHLTDLAVIVVAADDGVKPQTIEAIRFAKQAGVKMLVAINKTDTSGADVNRVKQQLSENGVMLENWGGDVVAVEVSAKTKQGIDQLLDMILLVADVEDLRSDFKEKAQGLIIEAHMEKGRGPVGVALVELGTLKKTDYVVAGATYAKIKSLESTSGQVLKEATPSTPVVITGFKDLPRFGDEFIVTSSEKEAKKITEERLLEHNKDRFKAEMSGGDLIRIIDRKNKVNELNVIIKADVQGSLKSVIDSLKALENEQVVVRPVGFGVGNITEKDVHLASSSEAIIYAFNTEASTTIKRLAAREKVSIRVFTVIYELIDDAKEELVKILPPEITRTEIGRLIVKGIFKITKNDVICGGEVTKGKLIFPALATVMRDDEKIAEVEVVSLKQGPQEVKEVPTGEMCGVSFKSESRVDLQEGDKLEFYTVKTEAGKL